MMKKHLGHLTAEKDQLSELRAHGTDGQDVSISSKECTVET
jgi:hypothetical protein